MNSPIRLYRPVLVLAPGIMAGAEKVVLTGLIGLQKNGLNPLMVIIKETRSPHFAEIFKKALPDDIECIYIESTKAMDLKLPKRLKDILSTQSLDLVLHSHGFKALIACYLMKGKLPHLHTHHGDTGHTLKVRLYEKIAMLTMKTCDQIIAVSNEMKLDLDQKLAPYKKIIVVENMLSFTNTSAIRTARLKRNPKNIIELLFVGRLSPEKGLMSFLEAFSESPFKDSFHLNILGDGDERSLIEEFIINEKMSSLITLHGFLSDPSQSFINPDFLIMPSLKEGLPMTLIEALASGLPVMANKVGAISSIVKSEHNGYLVKDFSKSSWVMALEFSINHYKQWQKNSSHEALAVEERFSLDHWTYKTSKLYEQVFNY